MVVITCNLHWWCYFLCQLAHFTDVHKHMGVVVCMYTCVCVCVCVCVRACVCACVRMHVHNTVWQWCMCDGGQGCVEVSWYVRIYLGDCKVLWCDLHCVVILAVCA